MISDYKQVNPRPQRWGFLYGKIIGIYKWISRTAFCLRNVLAPL